jgi:hypothetical protein
MTGAPAAERPTVLDLLERALVLDELDGSLAVTTMGSRVVLLAGEAGLEGELARRLGERPEALSSSRTVTPAGWQYSQAVKSWLASVRTTYAAARP